MKCVKAPTMVVRALEVVRDQGQAPAPELREAEIPRLPDTSMLRAPSTAASLPIRCSYLAL